MGGAPDIKSGSLLDPSFGPPAGHTNSGGLVRGLTGPLISVFFVGGSFGERLGDEIGGEIDKIEWFWPGFPFRHVCAKRCKNECIFPEI